MIMIRSVVRPEKVDAVLAALMEAGFPAVTKMSVVGRGKQRGIKIGEITYDEIPKELLLMVVNDSDKDGYFTKYAAANGKPLLKVTDALGIGAGLKKQAK